MRPDCSVACCDRPSKTRGMCGAHAERVRSGAALDSPVRSIKPLEELYTPAGRASCWLWAGGICASTGYGRYRSWLAHRVVYETLVGPIPDGLHIDHLCRVRACVNPAHLEPVTPKENTLRGMSPAAIVVRTNRCARGHELTPENVYIRGNGRRLCRPCNDLRNAARFQGRVA